MRNIVKKTLKWKGLFKGPANANDVRDGFPNPLSLFLALSKSLSLSHTRTSISQLSISFFCCQSRTLSWLLYLSFFPFSNAFSKDLTQTHNSIFYFKFPAFIAVVHPLLLAAFSFFKKPQRWLSSILFCFRIPFSRSSDSNFLLNFHPKQLSQGGSQPTSSFRPYRRGHARLGWRPTQRRQPTLGERK